MCREPWQSGMSKKSMSNNTKDPNYLFRTPTTRLLQ